MDSKRQEYNDWHALHASDEELHSPWYNNVKKQIVAEGDLKGKRILEIACGRGAFSNYLALRDSKPEEIIACDYSITAVTIASERYGDHGGLIKWRTEDIQKLSFASNYFDIIVSCETIEHIQKPSLALIELYRVLKPGGKVFLTCPNYFNFFGLWCIYRHLIGKTYTEGGQEYVNYALMPMIYFWVKKAGFSILKFHSSHLVIPIRVHLLYFRERLFSIFRIFGLNTFYILKKPNNN